MSTDRDLNRIVRSWMDEGVTALPDHVLDAVLDQVPATPQRGPSWPAWRFPHMSNAVRIALAAAAVVVVAMVSYQLLIAPNIAAPVPSPSPSVAPSAIPETSPSSAAAVNLPGAGTIRPGAYVLDHFPVPLTFESTSDLYVGKVTSSAAILLSPPAIPGGGGGAAFFIVDNVYADPCDSVAGELDPPLGPSVQDLVTALSNATGLEATDPVDVTVGEFQGKQFDVSGAASGVGCPNALAWRAGDHRRDFAPGEEGRLTVFQADGTRILINTSTPSMVDAAAYAEIQHILDSIRLPR